MKVQHIVLLLVTSSINEVAEDARLRRREALAIKDQVVVLDLGQHASGHRPLLLELLQSLQKALFFFVGCTLVVVASAVFKEFHPISPVSKDLLLYLIGLEHLVFEVLEKVEAILTAAAPGLLPGMLRNSVLHLLLPLDAFLRLIIAFVHDWWQLLLPLDDLLFMEFQ